jgi:hypothetical protein
MENKSFAQILAELREPFPAEYVEWKVGALTEDRSRALVMAYVDVRRYLERLDAVCPDWYDRIEFVKPDGSLVKVSLTLAGVTREEVGEADPGEDNTATSAVAQALKRACAAFGLGRYLYYLPQQWVPYDPAKRRLLGTPQLPRWAAPRGTTKARPVARTPVAEPAPEVQPAEESPLAEHGAVEEADGREEEAATAPVGQPAAEFVLAFGKHQGKRLAEVAEQDPVYLRWLADIRDAHEGTRMAEAVAAARLFLGQEEAA